MGRRRAALGHRAEVGPEERRVLLAGQRGGDQTLRPNIYFPYNESVDFNVRMDTVGQRLSKGNINLAMLFFDEPDRTGHIYGPN